MNFNGSLYKKIWSGKRGSNSRPQPWQGCALPTELFPQEKCFKWCPGRDLNSHGQKGRGILNPLCLPISPPGLKTNYQKVIRFECCAFYSSKKYRQLKIKNNCSIAQCLSYFVKLLIFFGFNDVF